MSKTPAYVPELDDRTWRSAIDSLVVRAHLSGLHGANFPPNDLVTEAHNIADIADALSGEDSEAPASEFCKGFDQGWSEAMSDRLNRDQLAEIIGGYMTDGGIEFRAYDLADRIIWQVITCRRTAT